MLYHLDCFHGTNNNKNSIAWHASIVRPFKVTPVVLHHHTWIWARLREYKQDEPKIVDWRIQIINFLDRILLALNIEAEWSIRINLILKQPPLSWINTLTYIKGPMNITSNRSKVAKALSLSNRPKSKSLGIWKLLEKSTNILVFLQKGFPCLKFTTKCRSMDSALSNIGMKCLRNVDGWNTEPFKPL